MMALSGRSADRVAMSGSGRKADMPNQRVECPLMTQSRHSSQGRRDCFLRARKAGLGVVVGRRHEKHAVDAGERLRQTVGISCLVQG
jgi:hypothetical protein